jgi:hypothetical protein
MNNRCWEGKPLVHRAASGFQLPGSHAPPRELRGCQLGLQRRDYSIKSIQLLGTGGVRDQAAHPVSIRSLRFGSVMSLEVFPPRFVAQHLTEQTFGEAQ